MKSCQWSYTYTVLYQFSFITPIWGGSRTTCMTVTGYTGHWPWPTCIAGNLFTETLLTFGPLKYHLWLIPSLLEYGDAIWHSTLGNSILDERRRSYLQDYNKRFISLISYSDIHRLCSELSWFWGRRFAQKSDRYFDSGDFLPLTLRYCHMTSLIIPTTLVASWNQKMHCLNMSKNEPRSFNTLSYKQKIYFLLFPVKVLNSQSNDVRKSVGTNTAKSKLSYTTDFLICYCYYNKTINTFGRSVST